MDWNQPKKHDGTVNQDSSDPVGYSITAMLSAKDNSKMVYVATYRGEQFAQLYDVDKTNIEAVKAASAAMRVVCGSHALARGYKPPRRG